MIQIALRNATAGNFIHTLEIDLRALRTRSNNPGVDVDRGDRWRGRRTAV
jgi:hypothetical protein